MTIIINSLTKARIIEALNGVLPGESAQYMMAPYGRKLSVENSTRNLRDAAVLVPILEIEGQLYLILTLRSSYDGIHSAQVSFPGGKFEEGETNASDVALREAYEEIGIKVKDVEILGDLSSLIIPVSLMRVYPIVGWINQNFELSPDPREVERIIIASIQDFHPEKKLYSKTILKQGIEVPYFLVDGEIVWGATAMIISELIMTISNGRDF